MKHIFFGLFTVIVLASCSTDDVPLLTKQQELVMDTLSKMFYTDVSVGTSKNFLKPKKPYALEVTLGGRTIQDDSLVYIAKLTAEKFYPTLQKKDKYKSIIVKFDLQATGPAGAGRELSYTFDLNKMQ